MQKAHIYRHAYAVQCKEATANDTREAHYPLQSSLLNQLVVKSPKYTRFYFDKRPLQIVPQCTLSRALEIILKNIPQKNGALFLSLSLSFSPFSTPSLSR